MSSKNQKPTIRFASAKPSSRPRNRSERSESIDEKDKKKRREDVESEAQEPSEHPSRSCWDSCSHGFQNIESVRQQMPACQSLARYGSDQPFAGMVIAAQMHLNVQCAVLLFELQKLGAHLRICALHSHSTDDQVVDACLQAKMEVYAHHGCSIAQLKHNQKQVMYKLKPPVDLVLDPSGQLTAHIDHCEVPPHAVVSSSSLTFERAFRENWSQRKITLLDLTHHHQPLFFTGHCMIPLMVQALSNFFSDISRDVEDKTALVVGYGPLGQAVARAIRCFGIHVSVSEMDPLRAHQAFMDGFVCASTHSIFHGDSSDCVLADKDFVITATGRVQIFSQRLLVDQMAHGSYLINMSDHPEEFIHKDMEHKLQQHSLSCPHVMLYEPRGGGVVGGGQSLLYYYVQPGPTQALDLLYAQYAQSLVDVVYHPVLDRPDSSHGHQLIYTKSFPSDPHLATSFISAHQEPFMSHRWSVWSD